MWQRQSARLPMQSKKKNNNLQLNLPFSPFFATPASFGGVKWKHNHTYIHTHTIQSPMLRFINQTDRFCCRQIWSAPFGYSKIYFHLQLSLCTTTSNAMLRIYVCLHASTVVCNLVEAIRTAKIKLLVRRRQTLSARQVKTKERNLFFNIKKKNSVLTMFL